jgi:hypothetical protein
MLIREQIAGNAAKLPVTDLNNVALTFFGTRTLYYALYLGIKSDTLAYARTAVYTWSIAIPIMALWHAGKAVSASEM